MVKKEMKDMDDVMVGTAIVGAVLLIILLCVIPLVATIIVGMAIANSLHLTGLLWWAFMIVFYLVVTSIMNIGRTSLNNVGTH